MRNTQLRLVADGPATSHTGSQPTTDPTRAVFEHWKQMLGRSKLCKLGPTRRAAINAMLTLFEPDELMLCVEGMAADPLESAEPGAAEHMRELEWLFARESRVERWAKQGEQLRARLARMQRREMADGAAAATTADPAAAEQAAASEREAFARLRALAAQMRDGRR